MEADINGPQRKILGASVRPAKHAFGSEGIALKDGRTLPFIVTRSWSAPAGHYPEQWFLVHPDTNEVHYESPTTEISVFGLQAISEFKTEVDDRIELDAGKYLIVFALGGLKGGEIEVEAGEVSTEAA